MSLARSARNVGPRSRGRTDSGCSLCEIVNGQGVHDNRFRVMQADLVEVVEHVGRRLTMHPLDARERAL